MRARRVTFACGLALLLVAAGWGALRATQPDGSTAGPRVAGGVFDQGKDDLGLPAAPAEHSTLIRATDDGPKYAHHPHLAVFRDELYATWSSGPVDEDSPGQRVLYCRSRDGETWSAPETLADDPDGPDGPQRRTAGGFWTDGTTLLALFSTFGEADGDKWGADMRLEARTSRDGRNWDAPQLALDDFLINEPPRPIDERRWLMTGEDHRGAPRLMLSETPMNPARWKDARLPLDAPGRPPNEPTWFPRADGRFTALFRDDNGSRRLLFSESADGGASWTPPARTGYPDATAKARAERLPGGRIALISNPSERFGRSPLAIALSDDGVTFHRAYKLRDDPPRVRYPGRYKGPGFQYPGSAVWREHLYVIYSVSKEDIAVSRVPLTSLR